jgi:hypothetical protein
VSTATPELFSTESRMGIVAPHTCLTTNLIDETAQWPASYFVDCLRISWLGART